MKRIACLILLCWSHLSVAQPNFKACYDKAMTTYAMRECISKKFDYHDKILNQTYQKLVRSLDKSQAELLVIAERAWIDYREKDCQFAGSYHQGGTLQPVTIGECQVAHTKKRIELLKGYLRSPK